MKEKIRNLVEDSERERGEGERGDSDKWKRNVKKEGRDKKYQKEREKFSNIPKVPIIKWPSSLL